MKRDQTVIVQIAQFLAIPPTRMNELNKPHVSVAMLAYNAEKTIGDSIQSVLDQSSSDWELIVVDDGSEAGTCYQVLDLDDSRIQRMGVDIEISAIDDPVN